MFEVDDLKRARACIESAGALSRASPSRSPMGVGAISVSPAATKLLSGCAAENAGLMAAALVEMSREEALGRIDC